ncbi:MAG: PP2C family serine/threonine-protein phosphatase [Negativicutes bacterium]|nr:PP2C family serine/threonine-protein phosphatase [Negativicutes bacterium]
MKFLSIIRRIRTRTRPVPAKKVRWKIAGCSLAGTTHIRRGRSCEDAVGWFIHGDLLVIAVADGAGSAAQPSLGSVVAVRGALTTLWNVSVLGNPICSENATEILGNTCQTTLNIMCRTAAELGIEPNELASTLIVVVANRTFCAAAHIGDGAVVVEDANGTLTTLTPPTNGEFANEVVLLGCLPTIDVKVNSLPEFPIKSVAVLSDGLQRVALQMPQCTPHAPFFSPIFDRLQCFSESEMESLLKEFLNSPRVNARCDDDKSLVTAQIS